MKQPLSNKQQAIVCMIAGLLAYLFSLYGSPILVKYFHLSSRNTDFIATLIVALMGVIIYYIFKIMVNLNKK